MAESRFDRPAFEARLATRWLGRRLVARAEAASTNDEAWDAYESGAPDGLVVVADAQSRGRGRAGRAWHMAPGKGLALSLLLREGCERRPVGVIPLASGLALARGLERLGTPARLKWPNDVMLEDRKLAGILTESRGTTPGTGRAGSAVVIGVGVNVSQRASDFPPELSASAPGAGPGATSLALAGLDVTREAVAAEFLNALEPLWVELGEGGAAPVLEAWRAHASFWGRSVRVRTASGPIHGEAVGLGPDGGLVLRLDDGSETRVLAGDLELAPSGEYHRR